MELLEREGPLEALTAACNTAGEGHGSVVLVTGDAGIGTTACRPGDECRARSAAEA